MSVQSYSRSVVRLVSVLLIVLLARAMAQAQNAEVLITVSGPWTYAEDPDNSTRVVITAPHPDHHLDAELTPAPEAGDPFLPMGHYILDIANRAGTCDVTAPHGAELPAVVFPLPNIDRKTIQGAIQTPGPRYAISLPKPCYYSGQKTSYSIISPVPISTSAPEAEGTAYTTLMVLHYFVTAKTPATLTSTPDSEPTSTSKVQFRDNTIGIQVRTDSTPDNALPCDPMSADSFTKEIELFTRQQFHLWFPEMNRNGDQKGNKSHYLEVCKDPVLMAARITKKQVQVASKVLAEVKDVENYFKHPIPGEETTVQRKLTDIQKSINTLQTTWSKSEPFSEQAVREINHELDTAKIQLQHNQPPKVTGVIKLSQTAKSAFFFSPGSADCHGAQTSVDGVL